MIALINKKVAEIFEKATKIQAIPLEEYKKLDYPVRCHADMLFCVIDNVIFCYEDYYEQNFKDFEAIKGYKIVKTKHLCSKEYPNDIGLNVLVVGKHIFCKREYTATEILEYAENNNYKIVNVNQGYASCSTLVIDENSAITSDKGIYSAMVNEGFDALLISTVNIKLDGYNCGFIGGSGCFFDKTAYFFGEIERLPNFNEISLWLKNKNYVYRAISTGDVFDFGGVKLI